MRYRIGLAILWICILAVPKLACADQEVTFYFDPADFYSFLDLGPGGTDQWSTEGDMFKLHEFYGVENPTLITLRSWKATDRSSLDAWKKSLSTGEGIGEFNIDLTPPDNAEDWGQILPTPLTISSVIAPDGWSTLVNGKMAMWSVDSSDNYVLPSSALGTFGFVITMDDSFVTGTDYTIWFGGYNRPGYPSAVTFDANWSGDTKEYAAQDMSGFETTLRLTAIGDSATADFDADNDVDGSDFLAWQIGLGTTSGAVLADGDADGDGDVDSNDLTIWSQQYGTASSAVAAAGTAVPEPSTLAILLAAVAGLGVLRRY